MSESNKSEPDLDIAAMLDVPLVNEVNDTFRARLCQFLQGTSEEDLKEVYISMIRGSSKPTLLYRTLNDIVDMARKANITLVTPDASDMSQREQNFLDFMTTQQRAASPTADAVVLMQKGKDLDKQNGVHQMLYFDSLDDTIWHTTVQKAKSLGMLSQEVTLKENISKAHKQSKGKKLETLQFNKKQQSKRSSSLLKALIGTKK